MLRNQTYFQTVEATLYDHNYFYHHLLLSDFIGQIESSFSGICFNIFLAQEKI
jgi:hypothetical protein